MLKNTFFGLLMAGVLVVGGLSEAADGSNEEKNKNAYGSNIKSENKNGLTLNHLDAQVAELAGQVKTLKVILTTFTKEIGGDRSLVVNGQAGMKNQANNGMVIADEEGDY